MTTNNLGLETRIDGCSLDAEDWAFGFAAALARENGWSLSYCERVVEEFRRYAFLADAAYQAWWPFVLEAGVWHTHVDYNAFYWREFSLYVLSVPKHGNRGQSRNKQPANFIISQDMVNRYRRVFGAAPPADIWRPIQPPVGDEDFADEAYLEPSW